MSHTHGWAGREGGGGREAGRHLKKGGSGCRGEDARLTTAPGAGRRPSPPRCFSLCLCPFLLPSASCPTLSHSAARSGRFKAPHPQGFLDTWRLTHVANRGWEQLRGILPCHRDWPFLAGGTCQQDPLGLPPQPVPLHQLPQAGLPFTAGAPSRSRACPILSLTGHTWGCPSPSRSPSGAGGHCQSLTAHHALSGTRPQPRALHPRAANTPRGTEEAGKVY